MEADSGHYYVLGCEHADTLDDNGERIRNDTVVELKDGEQETVWTALDAFPYEVFGGANSPDWMHPTICPLTPKIKACCSQSHGWTPMQN